MNTTEANNNHRKDVVRNAVAAAAQYTCRGPHAMTSAEISDEMTVQAAIDSLSKVFPVRGRYFEAMARIEDTLLSEIRSATGKYGHTDLEKAAKQTYYSLADWSGNAFADDVYGTW